MKYTLFKTKALFSLGIYVVFWHYSQMCGLRDDFGVDIDPGRETLLSLVPVYGTMRWWRFLTQVREAELRVGVPTPMLSPARTLLVSSWWFGAGPRLNRHVNALYTFRNARPAGRGSRSALDRSRAATEARARARTIDLDAITSRPLPERRRPAPKVPAGRHFKPG